MGLRSLSPESRYHRFFSCPPGLSNAQLRYLTEVDQLNHVAWVALTAEPTPAAGLGVARFVRMPDQPAIAEFSFAVIDAMQRKGLGRALLAMLHLLAAERGVGILRATCLPENESVVSWLSRLGAEYRGYSEGTLDLDLHVGKSPDLCAPRGSAAERFASALDDSRPGAGWSTEEVALTRSPVVLRQQTKITGGRLWDPIHNGRAESAARNHPGLQHRRLRGSVQTHGS